MKKRQSGFASHLSMVLAGLLLLLVMGIAAFKAALEISDASTEEATVWLWVVGAGIALFAGWGEILFLRLYPSVWVFAGLSVVTVPLSFAASGKALVAGIVAAQIALAVPCGRAVSRAVRNRYRERPWPFWLAQEGNVITDLGSSLLSAAAVAALTFLPIMLLTLAIDHVLYVSIAWGLALSTAYSYAGKAPKLHGFPVPVAAYCGAAASTIGGLALTGALPSAYDISSALYGAFLPCLIAFWVSTAMSRARTR